MLETRFPETRPQHLRGDPFAGVIRDPRAQFGDENVVFAVSGERIESVSDIARRVLGVVVANSFERLEIVAHPTARFVGDGLGSRMSGIARSQRLGDVEELLSDGRPHAARLRFQHYPYSVGDGDAGTCFRTSPRLRRRRTRFRRPKLRCGICRPRRRRRS